MSGHDADAGPAADPVAAVPDELLQIQRILVGGLSTRTDERFAALEASLGEAMGALEARVTERLDAIDERLDAKADRDEIADALEGMARALRDTRPAGRKR